jgi:diguanylate cyclase (GGDEF)-like protein
MDRAWGRPTTVALLDIDLFKGVNDTHGHHAGDEVLRVLATRFRPSTANTPNEHSVVRTEDLIGRTGGDEFTAILPGTSPQEAAIILERVRAVIADDVVVHTTDAAGGGAVEVRVSLSIGVAEVRPDQSLAEAIKDADVAAYASKRAGRNRVTLAGASIEPDIPASREEAAGGDQVPVMDKYRSTTPEQSTPAAGEQVAARR